MFTHHPDKFTWLMLYLYRCVLRAAFTWPHPGGHYASSHWQMPDSLHLTCSWSVHEFRAANILPACRGCFAMRTRNCLPLKERVLLSLFLLSWANKTFPRLKRKQDCSRQVTEVQRYIRSQVEQNKIQAVIIFSYAGLRGKMSRIVIADARPSNGQFKRCIGVVLTRLICWLTVTVFVCRSHFRVP